MNKSSFEITTQNGCSVQCLKYCPQELITSRYKGKRHLSLEVFKQFISTVPSSVQITFAGFVELFGAIDALEGNCYKGDDLYG
jgi:hypothetical protein